MYLTRNQAYVQAYRGFESHPLRQASYKIKHLNEHSFIAHQTAHHFGGLCVFNSPPSGRLAPGDRIVEGPPVSEHSFVGELNHACGAVAPDTLQPNALKAAGFMDVFPLDGRHLGSVALAPLPAARNCRSVMAR